MKFYVIFSILCFACATDKAFADKELVKLLSVQCQDEEGATDQDVEELSNGVVPETIEGKCMTACMGEMYNVTKDKKLVTESVLNIAALKTARKPEMMEVIRKVVEICEDETDENRCEAAYNIFTCIRVNSMKYGLAIEMFD